MKKAFVTGHTRGIGKGIYDAFVGRGWDVAGFSRTTGWDIRNSSNIADIIDKADSQDIDILVNNAYYGYGQVDLLYGLFDKWQYKEKCIVNISSTAANHIASYEQVRRYAVNKNLLSTACLQLQAIRNTKCQIIDIKLGRVDTPKIDHNGKSMLTVGEVSDIVMWILDQPKTISVNSITVVPTT